MGRTWLLALLAPLLVIGGLAGLRSVTAVFAVYHLGLCLLVPALLARREGIAWREHARRLGLLGPGTRRGVHWGLGLGLLFALAAPAALALAPGLFPSEDRLRAVLRGWGADPANLLPLLAFLVACNGAAEELFWRGFLLDRLRRGLAAYGLVPLFAIYHGYTLARLAPEPAAAALLVAAVVLAAAFWTWSRRRWGSLWPALLSHTGATAGWSAVTWWLLG